MLFSPTFKFICELTGGESTEFNAIDYSQCLVLKVQPLILTFKVYAHIMEKFELCLPTCNNKVFAGM